jgi:glycosyltransferase involved in cell wall biosynthesis
MAGERIKAWVEAFVARKGRAPKILHVGNIANNAYLNARVLNDLGIENHVIANDLYHVNSNPEWYDSGGAEIDRAKLGDDFFPNFWAAGIDDRVRPRWFAQGSMFMSQHYLRLLCARDPLADLAWDALDYERFRAVWARTPLPQNVMLDDAAFAHAAERSHLPDHTRARFAKVRGYLPILKRVWATISAFHGEAAMRNLSLPLPHAYIDAMATICADHGAFDAWRELRAAGLTAALGWELADLGAWRAPLRPADIRRDDAAPYALMLGYWDALFAGYDRLILYATQTMQGALTQRRYLAYEHGTIRSIPFDDNPQGRLTKAGFQHAAGVFITNIDYIVAKPRLEFAPKRIHYIPHAFDERPLLKFRAENADLKPDPDMVTFFWPTRQDWQSRDPRMAKQNDIAIHAAALARRRTDKPFRIVAIAWGVDVAASKALIAELGLTDCFEWIDMLNKTALWSWYLRAHCVIDQFTVSTVNGVTSESLMMGRPTMCIDDGVCVRTAYGESAPYLAGDTPETLAERFLQVINDPLDTAGIGAKSLDWALRKHSAAAICDIIADGLAQAPNERLPVRFADLRNHWSESGRQAIQDQVSQFSMRRGVLDAQAMHARRGEVTYDPALPAAGELMSWPTLLARLGKLSRAGFGVIAAGLWRLGMRALRLRPSGVILHFGAAAEKLRDRREPAPADRDWRGALACGYSVTLRFDAAMAPIGSLIPGGAYQIYWNSLTSCWTGIGPNGDMPLPDGGYGCAAAECPTLDGPAYGEFVLWGARFAFKPDGVVYHSSERVGQFV